MKLWTVAALLFACSGRVCFAAVSFDTFGPGDGFDPIHGYGSGAFGANFFTNEMQFVSGTTGTVDKLTLAIASAGGPNGATVRLLSDNSDQVGSVLGTWSVASLPIFTGNPYPVTTINVVGGPSLTAGTKYWMEVLAPTSTSTTSWNQTNLATTLLLAFTQNGGPYQYVPNSKAAAFRVETVPEPGSCAVLGLGALALLRRRKKK